MLSLSLQASWGTSSSSCNSQLCDIHHCTLVLSGPKPCPANNYLSSVSPYCGHRDSRWVELLSSTQHPLAWRSPAPFLSHTWTRPQDTWTSSLGSGAYPHPFHAEGQDLDWEVLTLILVALHIWLPTVPMRVVDWKSHIICKSRGHQTEAFNNQAEPGKFIFP